MSEQTITLKTVNDLRLDAAGEAQRYFIAAYQRGYRWSSLQVTQLLEDIREFTRRRDPQPEEFYCLQPLVLKVSAAGGYEVVDGQQRLITLLLILRHFNERLAEKYQQKLFTLDYETRPTLLDFLRQPTEALAKGNVDFFHLFEAVGAIEKWFGDKRVGKGSGLLILIIAFGKCWDLWHAHCGLNTEERTITSPHGATSARRSFATTQTGKSFSS
jgi:hypothetical protein